MRRRGAFGGMIAADIGVIDEAGHGGEQRGDNSYKHGVKRIAHEVWHRRKSETGQIE